MLEMAKIDKLTGIYNRAAFTNFVAEKCLTTTGDLT